MKKTASLAQQRHQQPGPDAGEIAGDDDRRIEGDEGNAVERQRHAQAERDHEDAHRDEITEHGS